MTTENNKNKETTELPLLFQPSITLAKILLLQHTFKIPLTGHSCHLCSLLSKIKVTNPSNKKKKYIYIWHPQCSILLSLCHRRRENSVWCTSGNRQLREGYIKHLANSYFAHKTAMQWPLLITYCLCLSPFAPSQQLVLEVVRYNNSDMFFKQLSSHHIDAGEVIQHLSLSYTNTTSKLQDLLYWQYIL